MSQSPMMKQYHDAKASVGDALLLFRMGDFYELFHDDAKIAAKVLGLSLTSRDKSENPIPMAGFPHHQLDQYLAKIINAGHRAAICDQVEDAKKATGLVKRAVTRIVSQGTLTDDALLNPQASNFLVAVVLPKPSKVANELAGMAWVDLSTGHFMASSLPVSAVGDELARIAPSECLLCEGQEITTGFSDDRLPIARRPAWAFGFENAVDSLCKHFGTKSLDGFGFQVEPNSPHRPAIQAAGAVLDYLNETQKTSLAHIQRLLPYEPTDTLQIDLATRRSLEITGTIRDGRREGSLLGMIDRTVTAMGARLLANWLANPLTNIERINSRLAAVEELVDHAAVIEQLRETMKPIYDIERLLARVMTGRASPRDLQFVARTLSCLPKVKAKLADRSSKLLQTLESELDLCPDLRGSLERALVDECPLTVRDGGTIRPGFHAGLDEIRELMASGKQWMANYQAEEVERTKIPSIKVGYNRVFGYYLEITHAHKDKVPENYIRKQTLKNAERYITPELKEYEEKILTAEDRAYDLEYKLFVELRDLVAAAVGRLLSTAQALAQIDVLASLAELARSRAYVKPAMTLEPVLDIEEGRHPVLDITEPDGTFVPNGVCCAGVTNHSHENGAQEAQENESRAASILIITGPNMAGKSTYIRQTALLTLMAQIGSFVPAKRATIGIADRIFARVGASDELSRGQSTFMVEMTETARILNTATNQSLVILDEIGRGTSTYDGLSLAWSIVEHLHSQIGCRTLFATHYHELTQLEGQLPGVSNLNVAVKEWEDRVVFLHQIVPGAAGKSYGIHVAQLAGVPSSVTKRAEEILERLEADQPQTNTPPPATGKQASSNGDMQLTLFEIAEHPLVDELRKVELNVMTPMAALEAINRWQQSLVDSSEQETKAK